MSWRRGYNLIFLGFVVVSIGFGLLKQVKTALGSLEAMTGPHEEAGFMLRLLMKDVEQILGPKILQESRVAYFSDRQEFPGSRPAEQYYYDAQYAWAPYPLLNRAEDAEYYVLDFISPASLKQYLSDHSLFIIQGRGSCVLASKARGR